MGFREAYADVGNTYQAVLMQHTGWHARSNQISDPLTQGNAEPAGGGFKEAQEQEQGRGHGFTDPGGPKGPDIEPEGPDSGYGPGRG